MSQMDGYGLGGIKPSSPAQSLPAKVQVALWALGERWDVTGQSQFHNVLVCWTHVPNIPLEFFPVVTRAQGLFLDVGCVAAGGQFCSLSWPLGVNL